MMDIFIYFESFEMNFRKKKKKFFAIYKIVAEKKKKVTSNIAASKKKKMKGLYKDIHMSYLHPVKV